MTDKERFTAYLTAAERGELDARAREYGTSANVVLRMAVRKTFGLTIPEWARAMLEPKVPA